MLNKKILSLKNLIFVIFIFLILLVFRNWFSDSLLSSGDWSYFYREAIKEENIFSLWESRFDGMGKSNIPTLWIHSYFSVTVKSLAFMSWELYERIFWYSPFLLVSALSSLYLIRRLNIRTSFIFIAPLIYLVNSYILMIVAGGQMGIALAYALAPLVIGITLKNIEISGGLRLVRLKYSLVAGLIFSAQIMFDPRIFYVTFSGVILTIIFSLITNRISLNLKNFIYILLIPFVIVALLHSFWIIPLMVARENPFDELGAAYSDSGIISFLSFAKIENAISLLHPNWPENIFGKVQFQRPEFLLIPLIAFSALVFRARKYPLVVLFSGLAILGIFLSKGSNDPFGSLYIYLFENIPGFRLFRDPTKWYLLIALAYSVLIPVAVGNIYDLLRENKNKLIGKLGPWVLILGFFALFTVIISPILGQSKGTLKERSLPIEYKDLSAKLANDSQFYRTLWIPLAPRLAYTSPSHPAVSGELFFRIADRKQLIAELMKDSTGDRLRESSIKYVVIPFDSEGVYFLDDRKYSEKEYLNTINQISKAKWIASTQNIGKIVLFEVADPKDRFWCNCETKISYERKSNTDYIINVDDPKDGNRLIFSERYSKNWIFTSEKGSRISEKYGSLNSYRLSKEDESIVLSYHPDKFFLPAISISALAFVFILSVIFYLQFGQRTKK
jgi:hypothetical protein